MTSSLTSGPALCVNITAEKLDKANVSDFMQLKKKMPIHPFERVHTEYIGRTLKKKSKAVKEAVEHRSEVHDFN